MTRANRRRAVFLDLNGTLVLPLQVNNPIEYQAIPTASEAVARLCRTGFICPVVTVQSRIGKGIFTESAFLEWFRSFSDDFARQGARLDGPYVCPHRYAVPCPCKKPGGLLYRKAAEDLDIDLASSVVVGDSLEDIQAARAIGCRGVAVRTGWRLDPAVDDLSDHVADDLLAAAHWILEGLRNDAAPDDGGGFLSGRG
jgi:histidinol-phosphate phosphatase family protein